MICLFPQVVVVSKQTHRTAIIPCGKCYICLSKRSMDWTSRLEIEALNNKYKQFITLTYEEKYCPRTDTGRRTVSKRDCQLFFKRLRYHYKGAKIRYYLCAEYGTHGTLRPHYHIALFSDTPISNRSIRKCWRYGRISGDILTTARCSYVARYCTKKRPFEEGIGKTPYEQYVNQDQQKGKHYSRGHLKEFALMSNRPAIGSSFLTPARIAYHRANSLLYFSLPNTSGKKRSLPTYFRSKIWTSEEQKDLKLERLSELTDEDTTLRRNFNRDLRERIDIYNRYVEYNYHRYKFFTPPQSRL